MASEGICGFTDCIAQMIGFALIGAVVGVGGAYLLGQYKGGSRERELPSRSEETVATAGLRGRKRSRKRQPVLGGVHGG